MTCGLLLNSASLFWDLVYSRVLSLRSIKSNLTSLRLQLNYIIFFVQIYVKIMDNLKVLSPAVWVELKP